MCDTYELYNITEKVRFASGLRVEWGQSPSPYNDSLLVCTSTTNVKAGCVAVAMGQIMAHHRHPSSGAYLHKRYNRIVNAQYDWQKMTEYTSAIFLKTPEGRSGVANLLAEAGYKVSMTYGCSASSAFDSNVPKAFSEMGYTSSTLVGFNLNIIKNDIDNRLPIYIKGRNNNNTEGHAWIIEGYKEIIYDVIYGRDCPYGGIPIPPTVVSTFTSNYLYFNLGHNGTSNGYYLAGESGTWSHPKNISIIYNIRPN